MNSFIQINDGKNSVKLEAKTKISLQTIRQYFPEADGLSYTVNEDTFGLERKNDDIILVPNISSYNIYYNKTKKGSVSSPLTNIKKKKINSILAIINGDADGDSDKEIVKKNKRKKEPIQRVIEVGWKHRYSEHSKYIQLKEPVGGIKQLILNGCIDYRFEDLKAAAIKTMVTKENKNFFDNSIVYIGNFQEEIYTAFTNKKEEECDVWEFLHRLRTSGHRLKLYILTTSITATMHHSTIRSSHVTVPSVDLVKQNEFKLPSAGRKAAATITSSISRSAITSKYVFQNSSAVPGVTSTSKTAQDKSEKENVKNFSNLMEHINTSDLPPCPPKDFFNVTSRTSKQNIQYSMEDDTGCSRISIRSPSAAKLHLSVPIINREDVELSTIELGKGGFGTVSKGIWLQTEVAVKRIPLTSNNRYILREVNVLDKVRHPNIISIMAVSLDPTECLIIMEYFESSNLRKVLFDRMVKKDYALDEKKRIYIAVQLSTAVSFLHGRVPSIAHKDIKPENILVHKSLLTKICDMGLSRFSQMPSFLNTTLGHYFHGTPYYMAPETIINKQSGNIQSDVWALACVIVELFTESHVWNIESNPLGYIEALKDAIQTQKMPDMSKVPETLKYALKACFEHNPCKRAKATTLFDMLTLIKN